MEHRAVAMDDDVVLVEAIAPEDPMPGIQQACQETPACRPKLAAFEACGERVGAGANETCVEEFFNLMHCVNHCAIPKLWHQLK